MGVFKTLIGLFWFVSNRVYTLSLFKASRGSFRKLSEMITVKLLSDSSSMSLLNLWGFKRRILMFSPRQITCPVGYCQQVWIDSIRMINTNLHDRQRSAWTSVYGRIVFNMMMNHFFFNRWEKWMHLGLTLRSLGIVSLKYATVWWALHTVPGAFTSPNI